MSLSELIFNVLVGVVRYEIVLLVRGVSAERQVEVLFAITFCVANEVVWFTLSYMITGVVGIMKLLLNVLVFIFWVVSVILVLLYFGDVGDFPASYSFDIHFPIITDFREL